jgi:hypothetical protein
MPKLHPLDPIVASGLVPNLLIHTYGWYSTSGEKDDMWAINKVG